MPTGKTIKAGFRKGNVPAGAWPVFCQGEEHACWCGTRFIQTERYGMVELTAAACAQTNAA